jgi:hypothetical protein
MPGTEQRREREPSTGEQTADGSGAGEDAGGRLPLKHKLVAGTAVLVTGALLAGLVASPVDYVDSFWGIGLLLALGVGLSYGSWYSYKSRQLIRGTPTSTIRSLAVGLAEVKGRALPVDESVTSPVSQLEACLYEIEVEEKRARHGHGRQGQRSDHWVTVAAVRNEVPFLVDDGTGTVPVDDESRQLVVEPEEELALDEGEEPPASLVEWAKAQDLEAEASSDELSGLDVDSARGDVEDLIEPSNRERRITEKVIAEGEEVYVLGAARRREDASSRTNAQNLVMTEHEGTGRFLLSDKSEAEIANQKIVQTVVGVCLGLLLLSYGLLSLLAYVGIV